MNVRGTHGWNRRRRAAVALIASSAIALLVLATIWRCSPFPVERMEDWPSSPVVTDRTGRPLLSVVGTDEQWRFPVSLDQISPRLLEATLAVEDARFLEHPGVDVIALARAVVQNTLHLRTVSGASTITMQVCRMLDNRPRTFVAKLIESFRSLQLERMRSKGEILQAYLNVAPYGGNLRGVEAGAQAWFGKHARDLSLAEAATLAGLPQSPSRYRPDRSAAAAITRRGHVLERMRQVGFITPAEFVRASAEPLILHRVRREPIAPHAAFLALQRRPTGGRTTIDPAIQAEVQDLLVQQVTSLAPRTQAAVIVLDIARSEVVAMVGSADPDDPVSGRVNGAIARRSPGSTLKPFVYAAAFEAGVLGPDTLVEDGPIQRAGWSPVNFDGTFAGSVSAADALRRSLNVPAILVAEAVGLPRCLGAIESAGIRLPSTVQARGGLAVVVGATEVSLLDLVNGYATLGRRGVRCLPRLFVDEPSHRANVLDSKVCATVSDILSCRHRQPRDTIASVDLPWFMWKTGTSSGRRDAWAVGHNQRVAIGVWLGRFSGTGSPELIGAEAAEPLLARLFQLPSLRCETEPPPPSPREMSKALLASAETTRLRISSPHAGAQFVALTGTAMIRPVASRTDGVIWFLNGRQITSSKTTLLRLASGDYELRCIDPAGNSDSVRFAVLAGNVPMQASR